MHYPFLTLNEDGQEALYYEDGYGENYYGTSEWRKNVYKTMLEYFQAQKAGQNTTFSLNIQVPENWWLEMPEPMFEMLIVGAMGQTGYDTRSISDYSYFTEGTNLHLELTITPNV